MITNPIRLIVALVLSALMFAADVAGADYITGNLSYYDPTPSAATRIYREQIGDIPTAPADNRPVYVAVADCGRIGQTGYISIDGEPPRPVVVFDCAGAADGGAAWMAANNVAAEIDATTAAALPFVGGHTVRLWLFPN